MLIDIISKTFDDILSINKTGHHIMYNINFAKFLSTKMNNIIKIYSLLEDQYSKTIFVWFLQIHASCIFIDNLDTTFALFPPPFLDVQTFYEGYEKLYNLKQGDYYIIDGMKIDSHPLLIYCIFMLRQYQYKNIVVPIEGDYIIDAGGCYGETAMWFSKLVGQNGKVLSFEPQVDNLNYFRNNVSRNNITNIEIIPLGLLNDEKSVVLTNDGRSARIIEDSIGTNINMVSLDSYIESHNIPKVDYIKMDIEGSEMSALEGMKKTIQKFSPKLAISVYHLADDVVVIPEYIKSINANYKIYIDHFTYGSLETVMFFSV